MEYLKTNYSDIKEVMIGKVPAIIIEPKEATNKTLVFYHGWGSDNERQIFRGIFLPPMVIGLFFLKQDTTAREM